MVLRWGMDLSEIRRLVIVSISSDDVLVEKLVLKGGNALDLIHRIGARASIDLDFSMEGDFEDLAEVMARLQHALADRFGSNGYRVFDLKFGPRPSVVRPEQSKVWGGYRAEFKIIRDEHYKKLSGDLSSIRRNATVIGPGHQRVFTIDISKFEYCKPKVEAEIDDYTVYVYTPAMIAAEKLRAICQQMPEYVHRRYNTATPRARDFYDIHAILTDGHVDLDTDDGLELIRNMFAAKEVPLRLLGKIAEQRAAHEKDWQAVLDSVPPSSKPRDFVFYFEFVVQYVGRLEALWVE
jgi:predicted nucleotidyltransferase component of viral defense system